MVGRSAPPSSNTSKRRPRRDALQIFLLVPYIPFSLLSLDRLPYLFFNAIVREKKKINHPVFQFHRKLSQVEQGF
jgi:hypothetical protein